MGPVVQSPEYKYHLLLFETAWTVGQSASHGPTSGPALASLSFPTLFILLISKLKAATRWDGQDTIVGLNIRSRSCDNLFIFGGASFSVDSLLNVECSLHLL